MSKRSWWRNGVRFACQGSGKCCVSHDADGYVFLTIEDRRRLAAHFGLPTREFTKEHCETTDGVYHLKRTGPACRFLDTGDNSCSVYDSRPTQCRTWPFWPENMPARAWTKVAAFCPGVGQGPVIPASEIEEILDEQERSNKAL